MQYFFGNQNCYKNIPMGKHPQGPWVWPHTSSQDSEVKEHRKPALLLLLLTFIKTRWQGILPDAQIPSNYRGGELFFYFSPVGGQCSGHTTALAPKEGPALGGKRNLRKNPGLDVRTAQPCSRRTHRTSDKKHLFLA